MSDSTARHINEISFLEDWIIDAMEEFKTFNNIEIYRKCEYCGGVDIQLNTLKGMEHTMKMGVVMGVAQYNRSV